MGLEDVFRFIYLYKTKFTREEIKRVFDYMIQDMIRAQGNEIEIDFEECCVIPAIAWERHKEFQKEYGEEGVFDFYERLTKLLMPLVRQVTQICLDNRDALIERLLQAEKLADLPTIYKDEGR